MIYLRTDQYTQVSRDCPVRVDMCPADDVVEISLGELRIGGDALRLIFNDPDTCLRLMEALREARGRLAEHLRVKSVPAMSQLSNPVANMSARHASRGAAGTTVSAATV